MESHHMKCQSKDIIIAFKLTLRPGLSLRTLRAAGMTILFFLSYGGGTPSKHTSLFMAALPRSVLWGTMPANKENNSLRQRFLFELLGAPTEQKFGRSRNREREGNSPARKTEDQKGQRPLSEFSFYESAQNARLNKERRPL